jgi:DNA-binding transcriptional LysR family regulator
MDIRRLKYFIVAAEERSISRAAERLHITQPPLSRHIQSLEENLGVALFNRTSWGVELTQAGQTLLAHARNIRSHVELATEQIRKVAAGQAGRMDIGVYGSAMLDIVPKILSVFSASHPEVNVVLQFAAKGPQIEALHQGRILIAFERYLPETAELKSELISREALWVALNQSHILSRQARVSLDDLRGEALVGEQDPCLYSACQPLFKRYDFEPRVVQKATDMISAVAMVAGGFGSALVPKSVLNLQLPNVVYRPLTADIECLIDLHCAYRKNERSPLLAAILQCVRNYRHENRPHPDFGIDNRPNTDPERPEIRSPISAENQQ